MKQFILLYLLCLPAYLFGQTISETQLTVSGRVVNTHNETLPGAHVWFIHPNDTLQKQGAATDADGKFTIQLPAGRYEMQVSYIGYAPYTAEVQATQSMTLPDIYLNENQNLLNELVVKGHSVTYDAEGYRMNIENNPHFKQQDLDKILNFLPGMFNQDGMMKVFGKPVAKVYINRRMVRFSGKELMDYLQTYHGKSIKDIQVITSTGAEEEASNAGMAILKITTTKIDDGGMLSVRGEADESETNRRICLPDVNVQTRNGKWSTYGMATLRSIKIKNIGNSETLFLESGSEKNTAHRMERTIPSMNYTVGIGYDFSPNDIFTIEGYHRRDKGEGNASALIQTLQDGQEQNKENTLSTQKEKGHSNRLSVDYTHAWKEGEFFLSGLYIHSNTSDERDREREGNRDAWNSSERNLQKHTLLEGKADFKQKIASGNMKLGLSYSDWNNDDYTDNRLVVASQENELGTYTDLYNYKEEILAAYGSYDFSLKKWSLSLGLRYEHKTVHPQSTLSSERNGKSTYNNFFPNVRLNYALNPMKGHNLNLNYARTIKSPSMEMLNPGISWKNEFNYSMGNPYLEPVCSNTYGGILTLFGNYSLSFFQVSEPIFDYINHKEPDSDILYGTYNNGGKRTFRSVGFSMMQSVTLKWLINLNITRNFVTEHYQAQKVSTRNWNIMLSSLNNLPKGFDLNINGNYFSPSKGINGSIGRMFNTSVSLSKSFFQRQLIASASYTYSALTRTNIYIEGVRQQYHSNSSPHSMRVSLRYVLKWGNKWAKVQKSKTESEEMKRM